MADAPDLIRSAVLEGVPHGFCTGIGHEGAPDPSLIVPGAVLVAPKQVHSALALVVDGPFADGAIPEVDALVTATPGLVLGIVTADCAPVLFADKTAGIVAAAHAGWRGAHGGVLETTVDKMVESGARAENIVAAIGPAIAQRSYEVDEGFRAQFGESHAAHFVAGRPGHYQFDLEAYVAERLKNRGIGAIDPLGLDTYTDETRFHSYRRATHRGEPTYGRQYSLIALPD